MSGINSANVYNSPIDFRIPLTAPDTTGMDQNTASFVTQTWGFSFQVIHAFTDLCGIGPQVQSTWSSISGSPNYLLMGNLQRWYGVASENIVQGAIVNLWNNGGTLEARNANASTNTKPADGFCTTLAAWQLVRSVYSHSEDALYRSEDLLWEEDTGSQLQMDL